MTDFDPYLKWLGIRDPMRPPHHYRLLGIELFESDPDIIVGAAKRQIQHVKSFADGPEGEHAAELVRRLTKAANVLRDPVAKQDYDEKLRGYLAKAEGTQPVVPTAALSPPRLPDKNAPVISTGSGESSVPVSIFDGSSPSAPASRRAPRPRKKSNGIMFQLVGVIGGGVAAVAVAAYLLNSGLMGPGNNDNGGGEVAQSDPADGGNSPVVDPNRFSGQSDAPLPAPPDSGQNETGTGQPDEPARPDNTNGFAGVDPDADPIADNRVNSGVWVDNPDDVGVFSGSDRMNTTQPGASTGGPETIALQPREPLPVPEDDLLRESRKLIQELYPGIYDRSVPDEEKVNLIKEMIRGAGQADEPENAFTLLSESATAAKELNQSRLCLDALEEMDRQFLIDFYDLADSAFSTMIRRVDTPLQLLELSEVLTRLTIRGLRDGQYEFAVSMSSDAATVGKKINIATSRFTQQLKEDVKDIERIVTKGARSQEALAETPEDEASHEAVGNVLCLINGDFAAGCEHWFKSGDSILVDIALKEQYASEGPGEDGENYKAAGDAWYDEGAKKQEFRESRMLARAAYWYELLLPMQTGLAQEVTRKRIDQINNYLMDLPTAGAFSDEPGNANVDEIYRTEWSVDVDGGGDFTVRISRDRIFIQRERRSATFRHTRNDLMFVASLAPNEDAVLIFRIRPELDRIDYKKIDNATGQTAEWGAGG
ncbi:MAG: hypothetical protein AAF456_04385, partial [Planctomycetota bacterium]